VSDEALQKRAAEVIRPLVPPDAEGRVARSFKQWNQIVRDHIRTETGLKLSDGDSRYAIPVRVVRGFPDELARLIDQYRDPVMWRLIIGQPKLGGLIQGLDFLLRGWDEFVSWPALPDAARGGRSQLEGARAVAAALQQAAQAERVVKQITEIHEDILGAYRFPAGQGSWVELYWLPIAMVAAMADVAIEDITVVVLIHELAHGYTHVGRDIDGENWTTGGFGGSAPEVVEGVAQFYTEIIAERLAARTPGLFAAYQALLEFQSGPYVVHREWLKGDRKQLGETVRFTLIAARSHGRVSYGTWQELMGATKGSLKRRRSDGV
jgi:hypothetical protein